MDGINYLYVAEGEDGEQYISDPLSGAWVPLDIFADGYGERTAPIPTVALVQTVGECLSWTDEVMASFIRTLSYIHGRETVA